MEEGLLSGGSFVVELIDLDVVAIVVGNEELEVTIVIEVVGGNGPDSAPKVLDNLSGEVAMAVGSQKVGGLVSVTCNQNMIGRGGGGLYDIGETWAHVGDQESESILEAVGNHTLAKGALEEVCWHIIEEEACF